MRLLRMGAGRAAVTGRDAEVDQGRGAEAIHNRIIF
jgi:hypothetical protein